MTLSLQFNDLGGWGLPLDLLEEGVRGACSSEGVSEGEISVTFLSDEEIQAMNREYLGKDRPTDVIAFALHEPGEKVLGDLYIGYEQALRQAQELAVDLTEELLRLSVHGALHVLGHDHPQGPDRAESPMYQRQEAIVADTLARRSAGERP